MKHIFENRSVSNWHQIKLVMSDLKRLENAKVLQKKNRKITIPFIHITHTNLKSIECQTGHFILNLLNF